MKSEKINYFLYVRKSSESEDRQVQSIDDQVNRLSDLSRNLGLHIKEVFQESKSAKKPNNRPIFDKMIEKIENGEASGIICWQINRLSRNPIDSGKISWLLQRGVLQSIQTIDKQYLSDDNVLLFSVESGSANQFILDLSKNVKRGIQSKLEKGWRPGMAPVGYINDIYNHTILPDDERFILIRKAWDLMLTGSHSVPKILETLNNDWGFRSLKKRRIGNKPLSMSGIYKLFTNQFYAGLLIHKDKVYQGKHKAMVNLEEFDRVQNLLGHKGKPRQRKHNFSFTGMIRCQNCGCLITAETKTKLIKSTKKINTYTYYRCTRQKKDVQCQEPSITLPELEKQILDILKNINIMPEFRDWALDILKNSNDKEVEERTKTYEMIQKSINEKQSQMDNLTKIRIRELITDDEFTRQRDELKNDLDKLREKCKGTELRADNWIALTEKAFNFAANAVKAFEKGDIQAKREILRTIGTEFILTNKTLQFKPHKWIEAIQSDNADIRTLELENIGQCNIKTGEISPAFTRWHGW